MPTLPDTPVLPHWFRGALIALVTLTLCSCQAPTGVQPADLEALTTAPWAMSDWARDNPDSTLRVVAHEEAASSDFAATVNQLANSVSNYRIGSEPKTSRSNAPNRSSIRTAAAAPPSKAASYEEIASGIVPWEPSPGDLSDCEIISDDQGAAVLACKTEPDCDGRACDEPGCPDGSCTDGSCSGAECPPQTGGGGGCVGGCPPPAAVCGCEGCVIRGPRDEYLCDGGDQGLEVGVRRDWSLSGLEQEDTIAHYDTLDGRVLVEPSNKVCIYAPRFGAVRRVINASESLQRELINVLEDDAVLARADRVDEPATSLQQLPPVIGVGEKPPSLLRQRQQPGEARATVVVRELRNLIKPYCDLQVVKLGLIDNAEKPWLAKATLAAITWTGDQAAQVMIDTQAASVLVNGVSPGELYADAEGRPCLRLCKLASTDHARPGDEIGFTLRFDNVGRQVIGNVTIVDNLTTRLEYVPESAEASVEADFFTSENEAGSLVLRWEIKEPVQPGEGGVLQFRVKVR